MSKYEVLEKVGEGSFGQVFKAKDQSTGKLVAHKVISKLGRSPKELDSLRQECKIQCLLNHPNIIQMLDSFETKEKIVMVTEFAEKELYEILGKVKEGRLCEEISQVIAHDLVSALDYLHSNLVLHRDLKPQNVLLEANGIAKLCDFGFARSISGGAHMLMSIKGTPLYMAPELIKGHPYDHNADLWSLGCIIYELIVGHPPFKTTCILDLDRLIKSEAIKWPENSSASCVSFLQGLLDKDPMQRLTWPNLRTHPFMEIGLMKTGSKIAMNQQSSSIILSGQLNKSSDSAVQKILDCLMRRAYCFSKASTLGIKDIQKSIENNEMGTESTTQENNIESEQYRSHELPRFNNHEKSRLSIDYEREFGIDGSVSKQLRLPDWDLRALEQPIENEEWVVFLQRSMEEIMDGEIASLLQQNCISIFVSPLRNPAAGCRVLEYVACLLSLPFVIPVNSDNLEKIIRVYLEVRVVPNLVYAVKLLMTEKTDNEESFVVESTISRSVSKLSPDELQALECIVLVLCRLVYVQDRFVTQFCDAVHIVNGTRVLQQLLSLEKRKSRVVSDLVAILNNILRLQPENADLVEKIVLQPKNSSSILEQFSKLLMHRQSVLRTRTCTLIRLLGRYSTEMLKQVWSKQLQNLLEGLISDKDDAVRNIAEDAVNELKYLPFYQHNSVQ